MSESTFLIFWIFLLFFILNFLARVGLEQNSGVEFFALFLCLSHPVLAKNNAIYRFFNFLIFFFYFFRNFLAWVKYERNSGQNFFFFFGFSASLKLFWIEIMPERGFLIFLLFFRNFLARVEYEWNSRLKFFFLFLGLSQPVLDTNNAGINFFKILNFFSILFLEFSSSGRVWMEFGIKIFFSLSRPISFLFG